MSWLNINKDFRACKAMVLKSWYYQNHLGCFSKIQTPGLHSQILIQEVRVGLGSLFCLLPLNSRDAPNGHADLRTAS